MFTNSKHSKVSDNATLKLALQKNKNLILKLLLGLSAVFGTNREKEARTISAVIPLNALRKIMLQTQWQSLKPLKPANQWQPRYYVALT